jgi:hypothetical protein
MSGSRRGAKGGVAALLRDVQPQLARQSSAGGPHKLRPQQSSGSSCRWTAAAAR